MIKVAIVSVALAVLAVAGLWLNWQLRSPTHDRKWQPLYATLPSVEKVGQTYRVANMRNWSYDADGSSSPDWLDVTLDPAALREVYFVVKPFGSIKAAAHTMLAFEFADGSGYVASVEARRTEGQVYGGLKAGILPIHDYMWVWATERDMYGNSIFHSGHDLYLYRLKLGDDVKRTVLTAMLEETAALEDKPKFYNTFFSNCTNVLARAINKVSPGAVPWNKSWHLPGYAARYLFERGLIVAPDGFETLQARSQITPFVEELYDIEDPTEFAVALRGRMLRDE